MNLVLVLIDPQRDTPEKLNSFYKKMKLNKNWTLLTGKEPDIRTLAAVLGVSYKKEASGDFSHSNIITLLSLDGEIKEQLQSLSESESILVKTALSQP